MTLLIEAGFYPKYEVDLKNESELVDQLKIQLTSLYQQMVDLCEDTIQGWVLALELHDGESRAHAFRVAEMSEKLAPHLGLKEPLLFHIRHGALLHDIGKLGVPGNILKKNGPLTEDEWAIMRKHPVLAYEMLASIKFMQPALDIPLYHHEKWDGTGYPHGLREENIPLAARIFALVDVWDALRSKRPYRQEAWSNAQIITYLQKQANLQFYPYLVEVFVQLLSELKS